jgi:hypothetical protein
MPTTLRGVSAAIRRFIDIVQIAHTAEHDSNRVFHASYLLASFGPWQLGPARDDVIVLAPDANTRHPAGIMTRRRGHESIRSICLDHGRRLIVPGRFSGTYKLAMAEDLVAVRLGFTSDARPVLDDRGRMFDLDAIVLDPVLISLEHAYGSIELGVEG